MLSIAICDDDLGFTGNLETMVLEESRNMRIRVDTDVFSDGKSLLKSIHTYSPAIPQRGLHFCRWR